jgi:hypothetical protein
MGISPSSATPLEDTGLNPPILARGLDVKALACPPIVKADVEADRFIVNPGRGAIPSYVDETDRADMFWLLFTLSAADPDWFICCIILLLAGPGNPTGPLLPSELEGVLDPGTKLGRGELAG